jgi:CheY-like chemotaxis protein
MSKAQPILVVDDDEGIRKLIDMALIDEGYSVLTAASGADALEVAEKSPPGMILLDMRMPIMDGWAFAEAYRLTSGPHAPIIVLTAARDAQQWAEEISADGFLAKPFDLDDLLHVVEQYAGG